MPAKTIPVILTARDWTKKKGLIAKAAVKTGVTEALTKFETEFKKVKWDDLDPKTAVQNAAKKQTYDLLVQLWKDAQPEWKKVQGVANLLLGVETAATRAESKYKAAKIHIPDSSKKHVKAIAAEAKRFSKELLEIDDEWKQYLKTFAEKDKRDLQQALDRIDQYPKQLKDYAEELRKTPTVALYTGTATKGFHQNVRGLNAALQMSKNEKLMKWGKANFNKLAQDSFKPKQDSEVLAKVNEVIEKVEELERVVAG